MKLFHATLSLLALFQLAAPVPAAATAIMVPLCGEGGGSTPLRIPMRDENGAPCCGKLCHVNDRKRSFGDCCGPEDDSDDT